MKRQARFCTFILSLILITTMSGQTNNPMAPPGAVVTAGKARFTILTPQLIRMEWSADGKFEDRASLVVLNRSLPVPPFTVNETSDHLTITTDKVVLNYKKSEGKFTQDNLSVRLVVGPSLAIWKPGMIDTLNLKGTTRTLDGTDGEKDVQLEQGLVSRSGWALIDDSERPLFDGSAWNWAIPRPAGNHQDWYLFAYGHEYKKALGDFTAIAGKIPMPPKFAFGYWWSRYWTYSDAELRSLVGDMERYEVPIDVLIIDMDWHETYGLSVHGTKRDPFGQSVGWTGYTWNKTLFPEPEKFLSWTKDQHLKTALNLHPASGISPMESQYDAFAHQFGFDTAGRKYIPFQIEDKKWSQTYMDVILHPLEKQGIDFWWLDWQAWLENKQIKGLSNTWWLNYVFFTDMERGGTARPLLFHRWGGLGNHRYQIGFSGDSWSTWEALAYQPYFTATAANVGYGYWSHDIGGHLGNDPDPELYLRWLQWGALSPILRTHSTKSSAIERRIWKYNDLFPSMRKAFEFRYALVPYIYGAARKAYDSGLSICRPLYYDYPEMPEAYDAKGEYLFGDEFLAAPVTSKASQESGMASKRIWLPPGEWYEYFTGSTLEGNRTIERRFALDEIPLYAKAGSIIPMYPKVSNLQEPIDTLLLTCIPGGNGETTIYEDDGTSNAYTTDACARTKVAQQAGTDVRTITIAPRQGSFAGARQERNFRILLPGTFPPADVLADGKSYQRGEPGVPGTWSYRAAELTTVITLPALSADRSMTVEVKMPKGRGEALDGMRGLLGRSQKIVEMMKDEVNRHDQIANAPSLVLKMGSLASRIAYHPERATEEIVAFRDSLRPLFDQIANYPRGDQKVLKGILEQFPFEVKMAPEPVIHLDTAVSPEKGRASIEGTAGHEIRYTTDGTDPDEHATLYTSPLTLASTTVIKAKSFSTGMMPSFTASAEFRKVSAKSVDLKYPNSGRYAAGGPLSLVDGTFGDPQNYRTDWLGFQQVDVVATIALLKERSVSSITARFLQDQESWIFLPVKLVYEVSEDGTHFKKVYEQDFHGVADVAAGEATAKSFSAKVSSAKVRFVRVTATNMGLCPPWHSGAGGKAWMFTDEVVIE